VGAPLVAGAGGRLTGIAIGGEVPGTWYRGEPDSWVMSLSSGIEERIGIIVRLVRLGPSKVRVILCHCRRSPVISVGGAADEGEGEQGGEKGRISFHGASVFGRRGRGFREQDTVWGPSGPKVAARLPDSSLPSGIDFEAGKA